MKKYARTLKFWLGCSVIVIASFVQTAYHWFPGTLFILFAVGWCLWQFHQKVQEMKRSIAKEKNVSATLERYVNARLRKD